MAVSQAAPVRVVIEGVSPEIDCGRFAAKATLGRPVVVEADVFTDGHDRLAGVVLDRPVGADAWRESPLELIENDRWRGSFVVEDLGFHEFTIEAWVDRFASWRDGLEKKVAAGLTVASELLEGAVLVRETARRSKGEDAIALERWANELSGRGEERARVRVGLDEALAETVRRNPDRRKAARYAVRRVEVERERAAFGAWYEMFPRSASSEPGRHGTFADCEARLPYVADMGFDVLYLPPIHPIGRVHRKGPNNTPTAGPSDPGSPWGIGAAEGGHTAIHPELGTLADFERLVARARDHSIEIALDIAFQCTPDHPWVKEHPEWFRHRPDGSIHFAENPPKKYQDIYPLDFDTDAWESLWEELRRVFLFWIGHGIRIFRVDNPHTKHFAFWEWVIARVRAEHPDVIFLAEAFTRPKVMRYLAKSGYSQSYTYFTWRNAKAELTEYFTELHQTEVRWILRPNLFANTPDILHEYLQFGGPAAFRARLVLAATLAGNYGIYGPPFELAVGEAMPHSEEYRSSEKYEVRHWDLEQPGSLRPLIRRMNRIRRENEAFRHDERLRFHPVDNDNLLFYSRTTPSVDNAILVVVNLDPHGFQSGWVDVPVERLGLEEGDTYQVHDLLSDARYLWTGRHNYVALDPATQPAHVFLVRHRVTQESGFDYFA